MTRQACSRGNASASSAVTPAGAARRATPKSRSRRWVPPSASIAHLPCRRGLSEHKNRKLLSTASPIQPPKEPKVRWRQRDGPRRRCRAHGQGALNQRSSTFSQPTLRRSSAAVRRSPGHLASAFDGGLDAAEAGGVHDEAGGAASASAAPAPPRPRKRAARRSCPSGPRARRARGRWAGPGTGSVGDPGATRAAGGSSAFAAPVRSVAAACARPAAGRSPSARAPRRR